MATPPHGPPGASNPSNFDREHYNHLIGTIKWILGIAGGAITLIVTVALWSTWQDRQDYKNEVKETLNQAKSDLKEAKAEYLNSLKDIKSQANSEVDKLENQMTEQVPIIRQNAENLAMSTVQKRLNEEFESRNIQALIGKVAEEQLQGQVGQKLEEKIRERTAVVEEQTAAVARLSIALDRTTNGDRRWLDSLEKFQLHRLTVIKGLAKTFYTQKVMDYKNAFDYDNTIDSKDTMIWLPNALYDQVLSSMKDSSYETAIETIIPHFIEEFKSHIDLVDLGCEYISFNKLIGHHFELYDCSSVSKWYTKSFKNEMKAIVRRMKDKHLMIGKGLGYQLNNGSMDFSKYPKL